MGSDAGDVVGRIKDKAKAAINELTGKDDSLGDADPDVEYEPTPDQRIMHDGMVVLSERQAEQAGGGEGGTDAATAGSTDAESRA